MNLTSDIYESFRLVPEADWKQVCADTDDLFMDTGFLTSLEVSFDDQANFWYLLVRNETGAPIAACCISLFPLDACLLAKPSLRSLINGIRRIWPKALKFKVLFAGLPFSASQSHLRISRGVDAEAVLRVINQVVERLAREHRARLIIYKEFSESENQRCAELEALGYTAASSLSANEIKMDDRNFDEYLAAMRDKYRHNIKSSMRRFAKHNIQVEHYDGCEQVEKVYTDAIHRLYQDIVERSQAALEMLPKATIHNLAKQYGDDFQMTVLSENDEPVAFACGIYHGKAYYPLLVGVDHELNQKIELYFNLVYEHSRYTLQRPVEMVHCGASADEFKARLGAVQQSRHVYVKVRGLLKHPFLWLRSILLKPIVPRQAYNVFKSNKQLRTSSHPPLVSAEKI